MAFLLDDLLGEIEQEGAVTTARATGAAPARRAPGRAPVPAPAFSVDDLLGEIQADYTKETAWPNERPKIAPLGPTVPAKPETPWDAPLETGPAALFRTAPEPAVTTTADVLRPPAARVRVPGITAETRARPGVGLFQAWRRGLGMDSGEPAASPADVARAQVELEAQANRETPEEYVERVSGKPATVPIRAAKGFTRGALAVGQGVGQFGRLVGDVAGSEVVSATAREFEEAFGGEAAKYKVSNPGFFDRLAEGAGSMAAFLVPAGGQAALIATLPPRLGRVAMAVTAATTEAMSEAGGVYDSLLKQGVAPDEAARRAGAAFAANEALLTVTNKLGLFSEAGQAGWGQIKRHLKTAALEGPGQESPQEVIQAIATGQPIDPAAVAEAGAIGALVGGGASMVTGAAGARPVPVTPEVAEQERQRRAPLRGPVAPQPAGEPPVDVRLTVPAPGEAPRTAGPPMPVAPGPLVQQAEANLGPGASPDAIEAEVNRLMGIPVDTITDAITPPAPVAPGEPELTPAGQAITPPPQEPREMVVEAPIDIGAGPSITPDEDLGFTPGLPPTVQTNAPQAREIPSPTVAEAALGPQEEPVPPLSVVQPRRAPGRRENVPRGSEQVAPTEPSRRGRLPKRVTPRVYHGTGYAFEEFSAAEANPDALYGPGFYFTEDPELASTYAAPRARRRSLTDEELPGYFKPGAIVPSYGGQDKVLEFKPSSQETGGWRVTVIAVDEAGNPLPNEHPRTHFTRPEAPQKEPAPNVQVARLEVRRPFDTEAPVSEPALRRILKAAAKHPELARSPLGPSNLAALRAAKTNRDLYRVLATEISSDPQYPAKDITNQILQMAGYDGLKYQGGVVTGGKKHQVWVAFRPEQRLSGYDPTAAYGTTLDLTDPDSISAFVRAHGGLKTDPARPGEMAAIPLDLKNNRTGAAWDTIAQQAEAQGVAPLDLLNALTDLGNLRRQKRERAESERRALKAEQAAEAEATRFKALPLDEQARILSAQTGQSQEAIRAEIETQQAEAATLDDLAAFFDEAGRARADAEASAAGPGLEPAAEVAPGVAPVPEPGAVTPVAAPAVGRALPGRGVPERSAGDVSGGAGVAGARAGRALRGRGGGLAADQPLPVGPEAASGRPAAATGPAAGVRAAEPRRAPGRRGSVTPQARIPGTAESAVPSTPTRATAPQADVTETPLFGQERAVREAEAAAAQTEIAAAATAYRPGNPFAERAILARKKYERLVQPTARDKAMEEAFPLGTGFGRKGDERRMGARINRAVEAEQARKDAEFYEARAKAFDRGEINAQGRRMSEAARARSETRQTAEEKRDARIQAAKEIRGDKEAWEVPGSVWADSSGYLGGSARALVLNDHREAVERAIAAGKPVPPAVLAEIAAPAGAETEIATAPEPRKYSSTQIDLPDSVANDMRAWAQANLPADVLAEDGIEQKPHVTVKYGLHTNKPDAVTKLLADRDRPLTFTLGKMDIFEQDDYDVLLIKVKSPGLRALNKKISDAVRVTDTHDEYIPHATVAYVKKGQGARFVGDATFEGREVQAAAIAFEPKEGEATEIPLVAEPVAEPAAEPIAAGREGEGGFLRLGRREVVAGNPEIKEMNKRAENKPDLRTRLGRVKERIITTQVNRFYPLKALGDAATKAGQQFQDGATPMEWAEITNQRAAGRFDAWLTEAERVMAPVQQGGLEEVLNDYLTMKQMDKRIRDLHTEAPDVYTATGRNTETDTLVNPRGFDKTKIADGLRDLKASLTPEQYRTVSAAADQWWALNRQVLDAAHDAGIVSDDVYAKIIGRGDDYVPFQVLDYLADLDHASRSPGPRPLNVRYQDYLRKMAGTERDVANVIGASVEKALKGFMLAERNRAVSQVTRLTTVLPDVIQPVPGDVFTVPGDQEILSVFENGERKNYAVPKDIHATMLFLDETQLDLFGKFLAYTASPLRAGATGLNIGFAVTNLPRDWKRMLYYSKYGARSPLDIIRAVYNWGEGVAAVYQKSDVYQEALRSGALYSTIQKNLTGLEQLSRRVGRLSGDQGLSIGGLKDRLIHGLGYLNNMVEEGTKMATFIRGQRQGATGQELAYEVANFGGSPNFSRAGTWGKQLNVLAMFYNARLQGTAGNLRRLRETKGKAAGKVALARLGLILAPLTALTYLWNAQFDDDHGMEELSDRDRQKYFVILFDDRLSNMLGQGPALYQHTDGTTRRKHLKIAKEEGEQLLVPILEAGLDLVRGKDQVTAAKITADLLGNLSPVSLNIKEQTPKGWMEGIASGALAGLNPVARIPAELGMNWAAYRQTPIVPRALQENVLPREQVRPTTSPTMIAVANALGVSPIKLEYAVTSATGGLGRGILDEADKRLLGKATPETASDYEERARLPLLGRLLGTGGDAQDGRLEDDLYRVADEAKRTKGSMKAVTKIGQEGRVEELIEDRPLVLQAVSGRLNGLTRALGEVRQLAVYATHHLEADAETKKELMAVLAERRHSILEAYAMLREATDGFTMAGGGLAPEPPEPVEAEATP